MYLGTVCHTLLQMDSLKMTISRGGSGGSRSRKPKRSRLDLEVDRIARLRDGADSESSQPTPLRSTPDSFLNGMIFCHGPMVQSS